MNGTASGDEKLMAVSQQLDEMQAGRLDEIRCPYCSRVTAVGQTFCCGTIVRAMTALLHARDKFRPSARA